jgi:hypothetical protein
LSILEFHQNAYQINFIHIIHTMNHSMNMTKEDKVSRRVETKCRHLRGSDEDIRNNRPFNPVPYNDCLVTERKRTRNLSIYGGRFKKSKKCKRKNQHYKKTIKFRTNKHSKI